METQFQALSDPIRRQIVENLAGGEACAGDIAARFDVTRPAVSHHLKVLQQSGLVRMRRQAQSRIYSLDAEAVAAFRHHFDEFWDSALLQLKHVVEADYRKAKKGGPDDDA